MEDWKRTGADADGQTKRHCKQIRTGKLPVRENARWEIDGGGDGRNANGRVRPSGRPRNREWETTEEEKERRLIDFPERRE